MTFLNLSLIENKRGRKAKKIKIITSTSKNTKKRESKFNSKINDENLNPNFDHSYSEEEKPILTSAKKSRDGMQANEENSKISIPLLDLDVNQFYDSPPKQYKQYKNKTPQTSVKKPSFSKIEESLMLVETPKKPKVHRLSIDSQSHLSVVPLQRFNSAPAKFNNSGNSAFTPYTPNDTFMEISKKLMFGDNLMSANIKMDYVLCLKLANAIWGTIDRTETDRLYEKHGIPKQCLSPPKELTHLRYVLCSLIETNF